MVCNYGVYSSFSSSEVDNAGHNRAIREVGVKAVGRFYVANDCGHDGVLVSVSQVHDYGDADDAEWFNQAF